MDHMVTLRRTKGHFLKQARYVTLPDHDDIIIFEILAKTVEKRDVMDVIRLSCDVPLMLNVCFPLCGPYRGLHHLTNPMHTLSAPCPNHISHQIY